MECDPIGTVSTPFETREEAPSQGTGATGHVALDPRYADGLTGVDPGDGMDVVWFAHRADRSVTLLEDGRGVFATRSPARPNPVCVTPCVVTAVDPPEVTVRGVDMLDGSPVIDLKRTLD